MTNLYEKSLQLANKAHAGQKDRQGRPYIEHLVRVSLRVGPAYPMVQVAALLHDIMEDCGYTRSQLLEEDIPAEVIDIVEIVSRTDSSEEYSDFITRVIDSGNEGAWRLKLADLRDNTSPDRAKVPRKLTERYAKAIARLEPILPSSPEALPAGSFALSLSRVLLLVPPAPQARHMAP